MKRKRIESESGKDAKTPKNTNSFEWKPLQNKSEFDIDIDELDGKHIVQLADPGITPVVTKNSNAKEVGIKEKKEGNNKPNIDSRKEKEKENKKENKKPVKSKNVAKLSNPVVDSVSGNEFDALDKSGDGLLDVNLPEWSQFALSMPVLRAIQDGGFTEPTAIQKLSLPITCKGQDIVGKAPTGSGKTLAFGIPIVEKYLAQVDSDVDDPRERRNKSTSLLSLIIAPTRELAKQCVVHLQDLAKHTDMMIISITGGLSVGKQRRLLSYNPDVIVATPGRLWDILKSDTSDSIRGRIEKVEIFVLDEADRLLEAGHFKELENLTELLRENYKARQTMVFSATFSNRVQASSKKSRDITSKKKSRGKDSKDKNSRDKNSKGKYSEDKNSEDTKEDIEEDIEEESSKKENIKYLLETLKFRSKDPEFVDAAPGDVIVKQVTEAYTVCNTSKDKDVYLYYFLLRYPGRSIVFVNNVDAASRVAAALTELGLSATGIYSHLHQNQRLKKLERFRNGTISVFVATDIAARGLDIQSVDHVIHYHLPRNADTYVHRTGRTARANKLGFALSLCCPEEFTLVGKLMRQLNRSGNINEALTAMDVDMNLIRLLKRRVDLAFQIAAASKRHNSQSQKTTWVKKAIEELGVDLDEDEIKDIEGTKPERNVDVPALRDELQSLLGQTIHHGFSSKYLTSGLVNNAEILLKGTTHKDIIGLDTTPVLHSVKKKT